MPTITKDEFKHKVGEIEADVKSKGWKFKLHSKWYGDFVIDVAYGTEFGYITVMWRPSDTSPISKQDNTNLDYVDALITKHFPYAKCIHAHNNGLTFRVASV